MHLGFEQMGTPLKETEIIPVSDPVAAVRVTWYILHMRSAGSNTPWQPLRFGAFNQQQGLIKALLI